MSKPILGPKKLYSVCVNDEVAVLERADGVHLRGSLGQLLQQRAEAGEAVSRAEIVLDVLRGIDDGDGLLSPCLDRFQQRDNLLNAW